MLEYALEYRWSGWNILERIYSPSFDFGQLRYRAWRLHTVDKAAADARRSPKSAGSCARPSGLTQVRRLCGNFRERHAPRCSAALKGRQESAVLSTRVLREWQANDAACLRCMVYAAGWTFYGVQIAVLHRRREVWRQASWAAIQGHTRGELLFVYVAFTGSGERAIHPTTHHASLATAGTPAR